MELLLVQLVERARIRSGATSRCVTTRVTELERGLSLQLLEIEAEREEPLLPKEPSGCRGSCSLSRECGFSKLAPDWMNSSLSINAISCCTIVACTMSAQVGLNVWSLVSSSAVRFC